MRAPSAPRPRFGRECGRSRAALYAARSAPTSRRREPEESRARSSSSPLGLPVSGVATERPGRGEFAELVPDHLLLNEDRNVAATVVHRDRVPDHLGKDRGRARPGPDHLLGAGLVHLLDAAQEPVFHERAFLRRTRHLALLLPAAAAANDQTVGFLVLA